MAHETNSTPSSRLDERLLTHMPLFSKLESGQIREILDLASAQHYDEGAAVFEEGQPADRFFLLLDGYIRVVRLTPGGQQVIVMHIPGGQLFGIAQAVGRTNYPATAKAAAESVVLSWPAWLWDRFATQYDGFSTETYKVVGTRMGEMSDHIIELATQQVEQRIANALHRLMDQSGREVAAGIEIDFPITRQDLSEMTGSTLHTVSRLLSAWEKQGVIASGRKRIVVLDPARLTAIARADV